MFDANILKKLRGKQTADSVSELLGISRQSAINLLSKLKKQGFVKTSGGGKQKRIYIISQKTIIKKQFPGMFDILNLYSKEKIIPPFEHAPHFQYTVEDAIVDLSEFDEIRILANIFPLFNHVRNWQRLHELSKKKSAEKKIGAIYDLAKSVTRVRRMPKKVRAMLLKAPKGENFAKSSGDFIQIEKIWGINIPLNRKDLEMYK